jgi:hypothetical protein
MDDLSTYAEMADIFGGLAIIAGGLFALVQLVEFRRRRRYQAAADLCRAFAEPELARAVSLLRSLPDGIGMQEFRARGPEYEAAAQIVGMSFETMGLLVQKDIASFRIVHELAGGLLLMMWRKIENWTKGIRVEQGNPRFGEWIQWLAERVAESESDTAPAFETYANWRRRRDQRPGSQYGRLAASSSVATSSGSRLRDSADKSSSPTTPS